jgi:hypothetical protein
VRIQEYARYAMGKNQLIDVSQYLPGRRVGPIILGRPGVKEADCECMWTFMPHVDGIPDGPVVIMCDKHELGALLAEERVRLEKAWAARGP